MLPLRASTGLRKSLTAVISCSKVVHPSLLPVTAADRLTGAPQVKRADPVDFAGS
jgi:hypothetical protein